MYLARWGDIMKKFLVILCVFLSVLVSGCGARDAAAESGSTLRPSEPRLTSEVRASIGPSRTADDHQSSFDPWPWDDLPIAADVGATGGGVTGTSPPIDDLPDARADSPDPPGSSTPVLRLLSTSTCNDRPLRLSTDARSWVTAGYSLWHLCYETPAYATSQHPFATGRPTQIAFTFFHEPSQTMREIATVTVPLGTTPWTIKGLVALSPGMRPFLNIESRYSNGAHLSALQPVRWNEEIEMHGLIQPWQVHPDGTQALSVPGALCMYVSPRNIVTGREYFFVPHTNCPDGIESCHLNSYECTDLFASPL